MPNKASSGGPLLPRSISPEVIILCVDEAAIASAPEYTEVLLLDSSMDEALRHRADRSATTGLDTAERHLLENYGTPHLKRHFNRIVSVEL